MSTPLSFVLFTCSTSGICRELEQFLHHYKINIPRVFLDTQYARERAAHGARFKITEVPTLVISQGDRDRLFIGADKISEWFMNEMKRQAPPQNPMPSHPTPNYQQHNPNPHQEPVSETPVPGSRRDSESLVDVESEEIVLESTKPVPRRPKKKNAGKKKKKGVESDTEMLEDQPPRKQHNPLSQEVQRPSKITSTKMSAEQMMKERNALNEQRGWPKFEN